MENNLSRNAFMGLVVSGLLDSFVDKSISKNELGEATENYRRFLEATSSSNRVDLTDEELDHIRSLSKKERKAYMKEKRNK